MADDKNNLTAPISPNSSKPFAIKPMEGVNPKVEKRIIKFLKQLLNAAKTSATVAQDLSIIDQLGMILQKLGVKHQQDTSIDNVIFDKKLPTKEKESTGLNK